MATQLFNGWTHVHRLPCRCYGLVTHPASSPDGGGRPLLLLLTPNSSISVYTILCMVGYIISFRRGVLIRLEAYDTVAPQPGASAATAWGKHSA